MKKKNKINFLEFPNKRIRSEVINDYLQNKNINKVVCFSCGNATKELKKVGLDVLDISPKGDLSANRWFNGVDINYYFKDRFNATSGYLIFEIMNLIAAAFKKYLGEIPKINYVHCGSGETLVCLKMAYPDKKFIAVYDNSSIATKYDELSPLNSLVKVLAENVIIKG